VCSFRYSVYIPLLFQIYCSVTFCHICGVLRVQNSLTKSSPVDHEKLVTVSQPGSRLLTSYNRHFVIKSIQSEQVAEMHRILTSYHQVSVHYVVTTMAPPLLILLLLPLLSFLIARC